MTRPDLSFKDLPPGSTKKWVVAEIAGSARRSGTANVDWSKGTAQDLRTG